MKREWETRRVRAYNLKPGDVIEFVDTKRFKTVKRTVAGIEDEMIADEPHVLVRFRRVAHWGLLFERLKLVQIRRLLPPKAKPSRRKGGAA